MLDTMFFAGLKLATACLLVFLSLCGTYITCTITNARHGNFEECGELRIEIVIVLGRVAAAYFSKHISPIVAWMSQLNDALAKQ